MNEYLPWLGVLAQYLRQFKAIPDWGVALAIVVACAGASWLSGGALNTRDAWGIHGVLGYVLMTLGVTEATSMGASGLAAIGANPGHPLIPVTNSK